MQDLDYHDYPPFQHQSGSYHPERRETYAIESERRWREFALLSELGSLVERYGSDPLRHLYTACMVGPESWARAKATFSIPGN